MRPIQISDERLIEGSRRFAAGVLTGLKSSSLSPFYVDMELHIWCFISYNKGTPSEHRGHFLFHKDDFTKSKYLSQHWWYFLNEHGEGFAIDFPIKIKPVLSWSPAHYFNKHGLLCKAPRFPLEKLCMEVAKKPCKCVVEDFLSTILFVN